jgi:hypothetical protein
MNNAQKMNAEAIRAYMDDMITAIHAQNFELARSIAFDCEENHGVDLMDLI